MVRDHCRSTQHSGVPVWPADEGTRTWTFDVNGDQPTRLTLQAWCGHPIVVHAGRCAP
eukprot:COSAG01_NODE_50053_length_366_cov_5.704120_1_plen_57_part_10